MAVRDYKTIATRLSIAFVVSLSLTRYGFGDETQNQEAKKIAEKVKRGAELSEKLKADRIW